MRVLIVEDDTQLNIVITKYFNKIGFDTVSVKDGFDAVEYIDNKNFNNALDFDLYVLDINIPNVNGLELVTHIRNTDLKTPIIVITASLEINNFTAAFDNGCSEYIKKPFHLKELDIRVKRLIDLKVDSNNIIKFGEDFIYDLNENHFVYKNKPIELRYKEKRLCELLIENLNKTVANETIYNYVWENKDKDSYPLRQLVNGIRRKLPYDIITTKVKEGYIISHK